MCLPKLNEHEQIHTRGYANRVPRYRLWHLVGIWSNCILVITIHCHVCGSFNLCPYLGLGRSLCSYCAHCDLASF